MSFDESSFMNLFKDPFAQEEESFNNLNSPMKNDNSFLYNQHYEYNNYSLFQNSIGHEDFKMDNEAEEECEFFPPAENISNINPLHMLNENDSQFENDIIEDNNLDAKNDNINLQNQNASDSGIKKTFITSKEAPSSIQMVPKSKSKKPSKRIDYALKYFKTFFSKYLKDISNKIIDESELPSEFKKQKIFSPNHISYTGNPKESDDYKFLTFFTIQGILTYYKGENSKNSLQIKNKATIESILNFIDESNDESKYEEVRGFFRMPLEQAYELYYKDEAFKKYAEDEKAIYLDQEFKAQNGFSLLENNGFIKVVKMHGKKNKSMKE